MRSAITFSRDNNGFLKVSVTTDNPALSFDIAKAIEQEFPAVMLDKIKDALSFLTFESPQLPKSANQKPIIRNAVLAFVAGAAITVAVIWIATVFDVCIHDKKKIEDNFDVPILGVIPRHDIASNASSYGEKSVQEEVG